MLARQLPTKSKLALAALDGDVNDQLPMKLADSPAVFRYRCERLANGPAADAFRKSCIRCDDAEESSETCSPHNHRPIDQTVLAAVTRGTA